MGNTQQVNEQKKARGFQRLDLDEVLVLEQRVANLVADALEEGDNDNAQRCWLQHQAVVAELARRAGFRVEALA